LFDQHLHNISWLMHMHVLLVIKVPCVTTEPVTLYTRHKKYKNLYSFGLSKSMVKTRTMLHRFQHFSSLCIQNHSSGRYDEE